MAILAVLGVITIPVTRGLSERSGAVRCLSNLRTWGGLVSIYLTEHNGTFPLAFVSTPDGQISWNHIKAPLSRLYAPAASQSQWRKGDSINGCPQHSGASYGSNGYTLRYYSYAINGHLSVPALADGPFRQVNVSSPSKTILFADATDTDGPLCVFTAIRYNIYRFDSSLGKIHNGHLHALFVDNHVERLKSVSVEEIYP